MVQPSNPELSIIIVNWNTKRILGDCLRSIKAHLSAVSHEVVVVDNDSGDGSAELVRSAFPWVRLLANRENVGFGRANNQGMRIAAGRWLLLLNSDTLLTDDSLVGLLADFAVDSTIGVGQCRLLLPDGRVQQSTHRFPGIRVALVEACFLYKLLPPALRGRVLLNGYWRHDHERDVDWVIGAFMLLRREVFEDTGGFCEEIFMYGEDLEWCYRIRDAGWRIRFFPQAQMVHLDHGSSSRGSADERIARCLEQEVALYRARSGRLRGLLYRMVRILGAALHALYFSTRRALPHQDDGYSERMYHFHRLALRVLASRERPRASAGRMGM